LSEEVVVNKKELIEKIAEKSGLKKSDAEKALKAFEGTFSVSARKERKGRNPQTGKEMVIPSKKVPKFVAGKLFKDSVE
jgi:DNA-binding protein HU-beta